MKKLSSKQGLWLIRSVLFLAAFMCICTIMLFVTSVYGWFVVSFLGAMLWVAIDEQLSEHEENK